MFRDAYGCIRMHMDVYRSITDVYKHLYNPLFVVFVKHFTFTWSPAKMAMTIRTVPSFCAQRCATCPAFCFSNRFVKDFASLHMSAHVYVGPCICWHMYMSAHVYVSPLSYIPFHCLTFPSIVLHSLPLSYIF